MKNEYLTSSSASKIEINFQNQLIQRENYNTYIYRYKLLVSVPSDSYFEL